MDHGRIYCGSGNVDEAIMPGFRFHPTDEELVGFYLWRKLQQKSLCIELIKQLDIYKYDPWDLPKFAITSGEKEWYFYCPRERKYRNSARPNRVTGGGFWKATGRDRPIYNSQGTRCIGLKKSLVFYKGRAAKGIKTDWMMHEFRLPSLVDPSYTRHPQRPFHFKTIPEITNESWAICKIFNKTSTSVQRGAQCHTWLFDHELTGMTLFSPQTNHSQVMESDQSLIRFGLNTSFEQPQQQQRQVVNPMEYKLPESSSCSFTPFPRELSNNNVNMTAMFPSNPPKMHADMEQSWESINYEHQQHQLNLGSIEIEAETSTNEKNDVGDDQWQVEAQTVIHPFNLLINISHGWKPNFGRDVELTEYESAMLRDYAVSD